MDAEAGEYRQSVARLAEDTSKPSDLGTKVELVAG